MDSAAQQAAIFALQERIAELEQENERLRAECGLRQIRGYHEGMERAHELKQENELLHKGLKFTAGHKHGMERAADIVRNTAVGVDSTWWLYNDPLEEAEKNIRAEIKEDS